MDLSDVMIMGNGRRYDYLEDKINTFKTFSSLTEKYLIWVGEGEPPDDVKIWIKKTELKNFNHLINEMKKCFEDKPLLEFVGVDNFNNIKIAPEMCLLLSRQNMITSFQNEQDLTYFILNLLGVDYD